MSDSELLAALRQAPVTEILWSTRTAAIVTISASGRDRIVAELKRAERLVAELRETFDLYRDDHGVLTIDGGGAFPCVASAYPELAAALGRTKP